MADTYTTNLNLTKPEPGAAEDTWGISLNADLDALDAIFSSSGTQINLNPNQVNFADNKKAIFGTGGDLEIYHNANTSFITESGSSNLKIGGENLYLQNTAHNENYLEAIANGAVTLYYNNSAKLATTSSGIDVTGTVTSDGLTVGGDITISDATPTITFTDTDNNYDATIAGLSGSLVLTADSGAEFGTETIQFHTGGSEVARFDSSQNFMVGKTTAGVSTTGVELRNYGQILATRSGNYPLLLNRTTSDGDIIQLRKDGTTVGVIGTNSGYIRIGTGDTHLLYHSGIDTIIPYSGSANRDDAISLGYSGARFKDLYLSGTAYADTAGIGTTSPSQKLHVYGGSILVDNGSSAGTIYFHDTTNYINLSGDSLQFANNGAERARFDSSGRLGIGTSSPDKALTISASDSQVRLYDADGTNQFASFQSDNGIAKITSRNNTSHGQIAFQRYNGTTVTESMRLDSSGRLGIGTTSPQATLQTKNTSDSATLASVSPSTVLSHQSGTYTEGNYYSVLGFAKANSNGATLGAAIAPTMVGDGNTRALTFSIASGGGSLAEAMRIDYLGRLGIGTTSPSEKLHTQGSTNGIIANKIENTSSGTSARADLILSGDANDVRLVATSSTYTGVASWTDAGILSTGSTTSGGLIFNSQTGGIKFQTATTERMRITSGGSVGIGTSSPRAILDLKNTGDGTLNTTASNYQILLEAPQGTGDYGRNIGWAIGSGTVNASINAVDAGASNATGLAFSTGAESGMAEAIRIDSNQRVGIGTTSPSAPLHVVGNSYVQSGTLYTDAITAYSGSSVNINAGSSHFSVTVNGSERARITSTGAFLVGKTADNTTDTGSVVGDGYIYATRSGNIPLVLNRTTSDGDIASFRKDGTTVGSIGSYFGAMYIGTPSGTDGHIRLGQAELVPATSTGADRDNYMDLGSSSARFDDIYATNGTIQTSDRNEKQDIAELTEAERRVAVAAKGLLRKFRWQSAVTEKGDEARIHFGIIAQDLQDAFTAEGLDASDYAMFISSTWTDDDGVEQTRLGVRYSELLAFIIAAI